MQAQPAPPKPWERNRSGTSSSAIPGAGPKPWEQAEDPTAAGPLSTVTQPARPWESGSTTNNALASSSAYGSGLYGAGGSSLYNRGGMGMGVGSYGSGGLYGGGGLYGSGGGLYGRPGGMYGSSMYGGMGTGSMYGGGMYGGGMYGGGMYGGGGMGMGGMYGGGGMMGPNGPYDPSMGPPPAPPSAWQTVLASINGVMMFFGRLSFLVDENAHAVHFFISALLQLLDRAGSLYAEVARFVLRVLFRRRSPKAVGGSGGAAGALVPAAAAAAAAGIGALMARGPTGPPSAGGLMGPPSAGAGQWDNLWGSK